MYKAISIFLILIGLSLNSCDAILELQNPRTDGEKAYNDGIYTEEGEIWKYGNENATVTIRKGRIVDITLRKLSQIGREADYEEWSENNIDGKPNLKKHRIDLANKMIEKQTYDVDSISGATISSENWKRAVQKALGKARK